MIMICPKLNFMLVIVLVFIWGIHFGKKCGLQDIRNKKFFVSCDVVFYETQFPYVTKNFVRHWITFPLESIEKCDAGEALV